MPTEMEIRVLKLLDGIEIPPNAGQTIAEWGPEAITVLCEAALGTYPGLRLKVRTNAVSLLGRIDHPQALETISLLLNDPNSDVSIRAMRAAGRQGSEQFVGKLGKVLQKSESQPLIAAEAVKALMAIGSPEAKTMLNQYIDANPDTHPHRRSPIVQDVLTRKPNQ